jgi:outer membrane protein
MATSESPSPAFNGVADRPETLEQAWQIALEVSDQLGAARCRVSSAEQSLESARAQRWPLVAVEGSYTVRSAEPAFVFDSGGIPLPSNFARFEQRESAAFRTKVNLPLYTSGRIQHGIDAAAAEVASVGLESTELVNDLRLRVAEDYVAVLRAQRSVEVSQSNVQSLQAHAHEAEMLFRQGQVPFNDLLAAQVAFSDAEQRAIQAANQLDASRAAYNRRLRRPLAFPVRIAELPVESVQGDIENLTIRALRNRPELGRLTAQIQALQHQAISVLAGNLPQFNVHGAYDFEENRFRTPEGLAFVGVVASWNVFDGGRNRHERSSLQEQAESLVRIKRDLESMIALEVRRAWLDIHETRRRLEVTSQAIRQADENLRVARERYAVGAAISSEVLDAEALRTQTYRNHSNATYVAVLAVFRLKHAAGELK